MPPMFDRVVTTVRSIGMLRPLALTYLIFLLAATITFAQNSREITTDAIDAVQNQRIEFVEKTTQQNTEKISAFITEMSALRSSIDRFTGIGIGLGTALTMLQLVQVLLSSRRRSNS